MRAGLGFVVALVACGHDPGPSTTTNPVECPVDVPFPSALWPQTGNGSYAVVAADVDGDGHVDVVSGDR